MSDNQFADVSSNNAGFHAGAYRSAGHRAVMIKATQGTGFVNPDYTQWVTDAHNHGLAVFHYHFADLSNPQREMDHFWQTVKPHFKRPPEVPHVPGDALVIDLEVGAPHEGAGWLREAEPHLSHISDFEEIVCYTFLSYFEIGELRMNSRRFHIAAWGEHLPYSWHSGALPGNQNLFAWQYTDGVHGGEPHRYAGMPGVCDGSVLNPVVVDALKNAHR